MSDKPSFFQELKRRNVFRVAIAYLVVGWLILQVADVILNNVDAPPWVFWVILLLLTIGFIVVVAFSWAFELTPEGLKRESEVSRDTSITHATGKKLDRLILGVLVVALGYFVFDKFVLSGAREQAAIEAALQQAGTAPAAQATVPAETAPAATLDKSIAVLPFVNMSSDPEQEYFSDGLSEELLNLLAKIPELQVAARTSAFSFKGKDIKIDEVARELGVAHVLEGSVRSSGDRIRVTAQLIRADNGFHLWSDTFDRTLDDVFTIQDEIAASVVASLKVTLLGEVPHVSETTPEAYALYLQARHLSNQLTAESYAKAVPMLKKVLEMDPAYAPAWASLSRNYRNMMVTGQLPLEEAQPLAIEAAKRALELDPNLSEAHSRMAMLQLDVLDDPAGAAVSFRRALELNPNDPAAQQGVASFHAFIGNHEEAVALAEDAVHRDPVDALGFMNLGRFYEMAGRPDDAVSAFQTALTLSPDMTEVNYRMGVVLLVSGDFDAAEASFNKELDEEYRLKGLTLVAHARGETAKFEGLFQQLRDEYGERWPSEIAHVYAWTGNTDQAFEWLDKAVTMGEGGLTSSNTDPLLVPLHGDPRWQDYLESIGSSDRQLAEIRRKIGWE